MKNKSVNTTSTYFKDVKSASWKTIDFGILTLSVACLLMSTALYSSPNAALAKSMPNFGIINPEPAVTLQTPLSSGALPFAQPLLILQSAAYKDAIGAFHIVGELQNPFSFAVSSIKISGIVYGSNSAVAGTTSSYADLDQLRPGEKTGFDLVVPNVLSGGKQYQLSTSYVQAPTTKPPYLNVILGQPYTDSAGQYHVVGEIINQGQQLAKAVKISTVFYDSKGKLVDDNSVYTTPTDLDPGMAASFDIQPSSPTAKNAKFSSINVQSEQYSSLNMNPSTLQQPLFGSPLPGANYAQSPEKHHHHSGGGGGGGGGCKDNCTGGGGGGGNGTQT